MEAKLSTLSPTTKLKLLKLIARISEQSFRRGFQQGHFTAESGARPVKVDLYKWRFHTSPDLAPSPHGYLKGTAMKRLYVECGGKHPDDGDNLDKLLAELWEASK